MADVTLATPCTNIVHFPHAFFIHAMALTQLVGCPGKPLKKD